MAAVDGLVSQCRHLEGRSATRTLQLAAFFVVQAEFADQLLVSRLAPRLTGNMGKMVVSESMRSNEN